MEIPESLPTPQKPSGYEPTWSVPAERIAPQSPWGNQDVSASDFTPWEPESPYYTVEWCPSVRLGHRATADAQRKADEQAGGFAAIVCGYAKPTSKGGHEHE